MKYMRSIQKIIGILLLLTTGLIFYMWFSTGDFVLEYLGNDILLTLIIGFITMIVPGIIWLINHKHLYWKKGLIVCIANSIVLFILAAILPIKTIIKNEPCKISESICTTSFSGEILKLLIVLSILYCLVNICFWVDFRNPKNSET